MENLESYKDILDNLYDGVYYVDSKRKITYWNSSAEKITGYTADEVVGSFCYDNILQHINEKGDKLCLIGCPLEKTLADGGVREMHIYLHHKEGYRVPIYVKSIPLYDKEGKVDGAVEIFSDKSERETILEKVKDLEKMAMLDSLTQIPNRRYIENKIKLKIGEYELQKKKFGVLFVDIDNFKIFNDEYGHDIGDKVLVTVANTFMNNLRANDIIGRWGGEEFVGIVEIADEKSLELLAEKFRVLVENTLVEANDSLLNVTISVGATIVKEIEKSESILKRADSNMYESKMSGRNRVTVK